MLQPTLHVPDRRHRHFQVLRESLAPAWGFASAFGPLLIAHMRQASGGYRGALHVIAGVMLVSILLPLIVSPPRQAAGEPVPATGQKDRKAA